MTRLRAAAGLLVLALLLTGCSQKQIHESLKRWCKSANNCTLHEPAPGSRAVSS